MRCAPLSRSLLRTKAALAAACFACGGPSPELGTDGATPSSSSTGGPTGEGATPGDEVGDGSGPSPTSTGSETGGTSATAETSVEDQDGPGVCGDGQLDPGEQCDHGEEINSDHEYCTDACEFNICGDGLLFADHEDCDHGAANSDAYGSVCTATCGPGVWCGDNVVQPEHEQCDNGPGNGTDAVDERGISCDDMCRALVRRIFVTSHAYTGDLGGLSGADEKCRDAALAAGLADADRFMALLSDAGTSMKSRYEDKLASPRPYVYVTGMKIADSYAALLTMGPGEMGLYVTETNETAQFKFVASNTDPDGSIYQEFDEQNQLVVTDCDGWTTDSKQVLGRFGLNTKPADALDYEKWKQNQGWLSYNTLACNTPMHLYCIEL